MVKRRIAYEQDAEDFAASYREQQEALRERIERARSLLKSVAVADRMLEKAAHISLALGVDGHRADITLIKAAMANAAFSGRTEVEKEDMKAVSRLVLAHRLRRRPFEEGEVDWSAVDDILA